MDRIITILFIIACIVVLILLFAGSGVHLAVPTSGGPSAEGIGMFLKILGH